MYNYYLEVADITNISDISNVSKEINKNDFLASHESILKIIEQTENIILGKKDVIKMGVTIVILIAVSSPIQTSQVVISGSLRGAGDTRFVAVVSFISITVIRPILTWIFCYPMGLGLAGAWLSLIADQFTRLVFAFWRFTKGNWTTKKV